MKRVFLVSNLLDYLFAVSKLWAKKSLPINLPADEDIKAWLKQYQVPAVAIGVIENNAIKTFKVFGELSKGVEAPLNTVWNVPGLADQAISITLLRLIHKGEWHFDEPLSKYLPVNNTQTTRMLLSQQLGYDTLLDALQVKFGKPVQQICSEELFNPVGMSDSYITGLDISHSPRFAKPHNSRYGIYVSKQVKDKGRYLITTIEDYCKMMVYVLKSAGLNKKIRHNITLGVYKQRQLANGGIALSHSTALNGITAFTLLLPGSKQGIVIFTNSDNGSLMEDNILEVAIPGIMLVLKKQDIDV